jgi:small basic protein (TIGR04137 family)
MIISTATDELAARSTPKQLAQNTAMSIHRSLRGVNTLVGERSVLTRVERIQRLAKEGKFDVESDSPMGLPKVRTKYRAATGKKAQALVEARDQAIADLEAKG